MRIISGEFKNRRIDFKQLNIRPTTDFAKESLFNIINNYYDIEDLIILDLFAGSGNISYEFASRRAREIVAVDNKIQCVNFIKSIKQKLSLFNLHAILANSTTYLNTQKKKFNLIFADPPYRFEQIKYDKILNNIFERNILLENGMLIIEHSKFINFEGHFNFFMKKKYGNVHFTFFKNKT